MNAFRRYRHGVTLFVLLCAVACNPAKPARHVRVASDGIQAGCDHVSLEPGGIVVHGVGIDFADVATATAAHLRVLREGKVVHEADAKPDGGTLRFADFRVDGITQGIATEPGHLNAVRVEVKLATGPSFQWTLSDADLRKT